jgi:hypothetical protein
MIAAVWAISRSRSMRPTLTPMLDRAQSSHRAPLCYRHEMGKRRADADGRRFFDEFECVKIPHLRAIGVVQLDAPHAIIQVGDRRKLIGLAHVRFRNGGSWSLFRCPKCARRANRLWLIEDGPHCVKCCEGIGIVHRTKWGFGRHERLTARDQKFDELIAKLDATTGPLRFNPAPKHWRGRARLVSNSRRLTACMRRSLIFCRLAMLASQQAAKHGDDGLLRAYQPLAEAARATDIKPIWRATSAETLQQALDHAQITILAVLDSNDPQQRLNAAKLMLRTKQARELGW